MKLLNLLITLVVISTEASAVTENSVWNNNGGNAAHTGFVDVKTDPAKFKLAWNSEFVTKKPTDGLAFLNPTINNHKLYMIVQAYSHLGDPGITGIYALNSATGETVWKIIFSPEDYFSSSPVFDNDKVYWLTGHENNYQLTAADAITGNLKLNNPIKINGKYSKFLGPVMFDHHLYIGEDIYAKQGYQYSVNSETGNVDWVVPAGDGQGEPTVTEKYVLRANHPGIDVINRQTGEKIFIRITDNPKYTESTPVWDDKNKVLYAVTRTFDTNISELIAIDIEQKAIKWKLTLKGYFIQPVVTGDYVYVSTFGNSSKLYEVNAITGKINWSTNAGSGASDMIVTPDLVFISHMGDDKTIAISRKTHEIVWSYDKPGVISMDSDHLYLTGSTHSKDATGIEVTAIALN